MIYDLTFQLTEMSDVMYPFILQWPSELGVKDASFAVYVKQHVLYLHYKTLTYSLFVYSMGPLGGKKNTL